MTEEWRQRFIAECGDCDFIDRLQGPAPELRGAATWRFHVNIPDISGRNGFKTEDMESPAPPPSSEAT